MDAIVFAQGRGVWHVNASPTMRSLGELLMGVAPAIDGADADLEMLGELFVGGVETAHAPGLVYEFWFVDHGAVDSAGGVGVESRWQRQNVSRVLTGFEAMRRA